MKWQQHIAAREQAHDVFATLNANSSSMLYHLTQSYLDSVEKAVMLDNRTKDPQLVRTHAFLLLRHSNKGAEQPTRAIVEDVINLDPIVFQRFEEVKAYQEQVLKLQSAYHDALDAQKNPAEEGVCRFVSLGIGQWLEDYTAKYPDVPADVSEELARISDAISQAAKQSSALER